MFKSLKKLFDRTPANPRFELKTGDGRIDPFLTHVSKELASKDVKLVVWLSSFVMDPDGRTCGGQFHSDIPMLEFATGRDPDVWLGLVVHEFCHFLQWRDSTPAWKACYSPDGNDMTENIWMWIAGDRQLSREDSDAVCDLSRNVEHEAELMALDIIDRFDLPIDKIDYAQRASAYITFYNHIKKNRKWCRLPPYDNIPEDAKAVLPSIYQEKIEELPEALERFYDTIV